MDAGYDIALGLAAGFLGGMLGVGGGFIMVPGLVLLLDVEQHTAQGVSLGAILAMSVLGSFAHLRQGTLAPRIVAWSAPTALGFGLLGGYLAGLVDAPVLTRMFGALLVGVGARTLWSMRRALWPRRHGEQRQGG
ncbi:MAG: sulfite exporter TauE/SafE family protein [Chloroflexi bacterium]|nr:sulfite exporter TauE/SafE family protein [Chloroflexota bacterium]